MKKLILLTIAIWLGIVSSMAIPAQRGVKKTLTLKDGTLVEGMLTGDEYVNFYRTPDNRAVQLVDGQFRYVKVDSLHALHARRMAVQNKVRAKKVARKNKYTGKRRGLVILVEFPDVKFTYSKTTFEDFFNKVGFNECGMKGSVHDYFLEQSYGQFDLEFDVAGPVAVSENTSYYAASNSHVAAMVKEVCKEVDDDVDFSIYDWDSDGMVDQVYVIYAGYGAAQGASGTIWPHEWQVLATGSVYTTGDGVDVDTYGASCELRGNGVSETGMLDGVGTACHEFSHCLGLPDFYDTSGDNFGMNAWDLMDYGCYNGGNNGLSPCGYTAYERWVSGWLEPTELNSSQQVTDMPALQDAPVAYIVYNEKNKNEYYLLANHQMKGFDEFAFGHGMLVTHVDYDASAWNTNSVNITSDHQRMTIVPADNALTVNDLDGDPYPGTSGNMELTDNSSPVATLYNANISGNKLMSKPITDIEEINGLITFNFMGGVSIDAPVALGATGIDRQSGTFTANWTPVEGAVSYTVALTKTTYEDDFHIFEEDFANFVTTSAGSVDLSSSMDDYMDEPGWTGANLYTSPHGLRVGTYGSEGYLVSPIYEQPENGGITILISPLSASSTDLGSLELRIIAVDMNGQYMTCTLSDIPLAGTEGGGYACLIPVSNWSYGRFQIGVYAKGSGVYVKSLTALDGVYSWEDIESASVPAAKYVSRPDKVKYIELETSDFKWMGGAIQSVTLSRSQRVKEVKSITYYSTEETHYDFTNLEKTLYAYKVYVTTGDGRSAWSNEITIDFSDGAVLKGDLNNDGAVSIADVTALVNLILGNGTLSATADMNNDGIISIADVTKLVNVLLGKE